MFAPANSLWRDLHQEICSWQLAGDVLIIGGDWNEDMTTLQWKQFWIHLGLSTMDSFTGNNPYPTYFRGVKQLDNVYVSPILTTVSGGFISASAGVLGADHAALWLDIPLEVLQLTTFSAWKTQAHWLN